MNVLINHPKFGSLWLHGAIIISDYVIGQVWDRTDIGSVYLPDDYMGEPVTMNFPASCIRKKEGEE